MQLPSMIKGWLNPQATPESLMREYQQTRSNQSLSRLIDLLSQPLFHYLCSQCPKPLAEDILQTTWLKLIKNPQNFQANSNVKAWLFTIARNTLIDELRKQQKWQQQAFDENTLMIEASQQIEQQQQLDKLAKLFQQTLSALPFAQKEAFILQQEGFSLIEIAQMTNSNSEAVKSRLRYAKTKLQQALEPYHD